MYKIVATYLCLIVSLGAAYEVVQNAYGAQYYLVPLAEVRYERVRRQATSPEINVDSYGLSHTGTIIDTDNHRLDGTATVVKPWGEGPATTGGNLEYVHKPTDSKFTVDATNTRGYGTDVKAQGQYNFWKSNDGRTTADLTGEYSRHYGGMGGTGKPNYSAFLNLNHRF